MQKVLIITYYWPPAGGPGVQRWLKFVKYLRHYHVEPVVFIPDNPHYPLQDDSFLNELPKDISIIKKSIFEPYGLASIISKKKTNRISSGIIQTKNPSFLEKSMLWIRGNLFIPDARKFWIKPSVKFLQTYLLQEDITTIITSGPPHSLHLIGLRLKKQMELQWIADFRDPWTSIGYHKKLRLTNKSKRKHKVLEATVLQTADKIVVTSPTTKNEFAAITSKPIKVITNGYDGDLSDATTFDAEFTLSHIGSLLTGRNPLNLWQVLGELVSENEAFKAVFKLQLIGVVSADVLAAIHSFGLESYINLRGYVSHDEALRLQEQSQVLLLVEIDSKETKGIIPGKVFEYLKANRPILALGPEGWDARNIITKTNAGAVFNYTAKENLKTVLLKWFNAFQQKQLLSTSVDIAQYSRKALTKELAAYIKWE